MDVKEGKRIRKSRSDSETCNHSNTEKETANGSDTGNIICINCGVVFYPSGLQGLLRAVFSLRIRS